MDMEFVLTVVVVVVAVVPTAWDFPFPIITIGTPSLYHVIEGKGVPSKAHVKLTLWPLTTESRGGNLDTETGDFRPVGETREC